MESGQFMYSYLDTVCCKSRRSVCRENPFPLPKYSRVLPLDRVLPEIYTILIFSLC